MDGAELETKGIFCVCINQYMAQFMKEEKIKKQS